MKELLTKILSHLSKNTLITIVVALGILSARYWYKDYTERQNSLKIDINKVIDSQVKIKGEVDDNFRYLRYGIDELKQGQAVINVKIDILKQAQIKPIQQQINNVDNLVERLEPVKAVRDTVMMPPAASNYAMIDHAIENNITIPEKTQKKSFFKRIFR